MKKLIRKFIPSFLLDWYHFLLAFLGAVLYRFPSRKLIVIGVTGTNGKSTTINLITQILEEAGHKVASLSSIRFKIGEKERKNALKMTMPGRFKIQKFLREAVDSGCQYAVLEVTSEGIKQHRHRFISFKTAAITNLTKEHIEAHGSFKKYREAKADLFKVAKKIHIVNLDDKNAEYFLKFPTDKKWGYSFKISNFQFPISKEFPISNFQTVMAEEIKISNKGIRFFVNNTEFNLKLLGEFNVYNSLLAICIGLSQEIDLETIKNALKKIKEVPGRMEKVISEPFSVFADYAHTPDALEKVYQTIQKGKNNPPNGGQKSKMICVLGSCGGGRDKWKRPEMGRIAFEYCDEIILTNEDPYNENPEKILSDIESGFLKAKSEKVYKIIDRKEAISKALGLAKQGDAVIITGKGCEPWMCVAGGKKIAWDDRKIIKEEFKKLQENSSSQI